jgi:hypothetical protein
MQMIQSHCDFPRLIEIESQRIKSYLEKIVLRRPILILRVNLEFT